MLAEFCIPRYNFDQLVTSLSDWNLLSALLSFHSICCLPQIQRLMFSSLSLCQQSSHFYPHHPTTRVCVCVHVHMLTHTCSLMALPPHPGLYCLHVTPSNAALTKAWVAHPRLTQLAIFEPIPLPIHTNLHSCHSALLLPNTPLLPTSVSVCSLCLGLPLLLLFYPSTKFRSNSNSFMPTEISFPLFPYSSRALFQVCLVYFL